MSENRIVFEGLAELYAALRALPDTLTAEGLAIANDAASSASAAATSEYPEVTGKLRARMSIRRASASRFGFALQVRNSAPHAQLYEYGTVARHTSLGYNRGAMPARHVFGRVMPRYRHRMYTALAEMVERQGLRVTGEEA